MMAAAGNWNDLSNKLRRQLAERRRQPERSLISFLNDKCLYLIDFNADFLV